MHLGALQQPHRIVDTAILVEIGSKGNAIQIKSILACNLNLLIILSCDIHIERSICTAMIAQGITICNHMRTLTDSFKDKISRTLAGTCRQSRLIESFTSIITLALTINIVVGMRHRDLFPSRLVFTEKPMYQRLARMRTICPAGISSGHLRYR